MISRSFPIDSLEESLIALYVLKNTLLYTVASRGTIKRDESIDTMSRALSADFRMEMRHPARGSPRDKSNCCKSEIEPITRGKCFIQCLLMHMLPSPARALRAFSGTRASPRVLYEFIYRLPYLRAIVSAEFASGES